MATKKTKPKKGRKMGQAWLSYWRGEAQSGDAWKRSRANAVLALAAYAERAGTEGVLAGIKSGGAMALEGVKARGRR